MVKRILFALLALLAIAQPASAQTFPVPQDILDAGHWGADGWDPVTPVYASGGARNLPNTSTPPAYAYEFADIPSVTTGRIINGSFGGTNFCPINGTTCIEAKFRTHLNCTHLLRDDPIRNPRQPGASHLHEFAGNPTVNAYSTFAKLRNEKWTAAGGDNINGTGYWFSPPKKINPFGDGKDYAVRCDVVFVYYVEEPAASSYLKYLLLGQRYVTGRNMDDPDDLQVKAEIATANALPGNTGRYSYIGNGFVGWYCLPTPNGSPLGSPKPNTNNGGTDPWGGTCTAGMQIYAEIVAPECWDGVNFWSPGGYKHFRHYIRDNLYGENVCPLNYYRVPQGQFKFMFTHQGPSDYMTWRSEADDAMQAKLTALGTPRTVNNGEAFHTDWQGAWDKTVFRAFQNNCVGVEGNTPHTCADSIFSATQKLVATETGPTRSPQVDLNTQYGTTLASKMFAVPAASPSTLHIHGMVSNDNQVIANDNEQLTAIAGAEKISFNLASR